MAQQLAVDSRDTQGKRRNRRLRAAGRVPAILYGHGLENVSLAVDADELASVIRHGSRLVSLAGAVNESAFIRELQWDTWGTHIVHVDFTRISEHEIVEVRVPVEQLQVGDRFVVRPGEKVATDGVVEAGTSAIDASLLTGESAPVEVGPGDAVTGATVNLVGRKTWTDSSYKNYYRWVYFKASGVAGIQPRPPRGHLCGEPQLPRRRVARLTLAGSACKAGTRKGVGKYIMESLILAQNERWRRVLSMQVERQGQQCP
jgi:ribosomal protein L25 (general stress protein Ctc)